MTVLEFPHVPRLISIPVPEHKCSDDLAMLNERFVRHVGTVVQCTCKRFYEAVRVTHRNEDTYVWDFIPPGTTKYTQAALKANEKDKYSD